MKIQIVKKGSKVKPIAACPFFIDNPDGVDVRKPAHKE